MIPDTPKYINQRLGSINNYAWNYFFPGDSLNKRLKKLETKRERQQELARLKGIIQESSYVLYIFFLNKFFMEGSEAAKKAVDTFLEHNIEGFKIGRQVFQGRNENVMRGEVLSKKLLNSIQDEELVVLIKDSNYAYQVIERYRAIIENRQ